MQIKPLAFNIAHKGLPLVLISEVQITAAFDPASPPNKSDLKKYLAIWDTGATNSCITAKVVQECGLLPSGVARVSTPDGEGDKNTYLASIELPNHVSFPQVRVTEAKIIGNVEVLIGMDIISRGDFAVTNKDENTNFSFRIPSIECIDFVKQANAKPPIAVSNKVSRNSPCPCGSNKKYKYCCGK